MTQLPSAKNQNEGSALSPLANVKATREVLAAYGLSTKHSLGQNFLVNNAIVKKIIKLSGVNSNDNVLEVGPGIGTLSIALLKNCAHATLIERDSNLPQVLESTLGSYKHKFELVQKDALQISKGDLNPAFMPNKFVSNLPYNVAATVLLAYFQKFPSIESATVMVQREVAERICAKPKTKNYGAYTVKLSLYASVSAKFNVSANNFFPPPRVESTVVHMLRKSPVNSDGNKLTQLEIETACTMADAAFTNRRKTLLNSCKTYFASHTFHGAQVSSCLDEIFSKAGINPKCRGEVLSVQDFIELGRCLIAQSLN